MGKKKKKGKQKDDDGSAAALDAVTDAPEPTPTPPDGPARKKTKGKRAKKTDAPPGEAADANPVPATGVTPLVVVESAPADSGEPAPTKRSKEPDHPRASEDLTEAIREALRMRPGLQLTDIDPSGTPAFDGDKKDAEAVMADRADEIADWQERLYAESKEGGTRSLLLVVQGMDTSGKGGIMRHVVGLLDPQGVDITAFKAPTKEERSHPFLWRIRRALPAPGKVGVFDRSQYEDVLIVRVRNLVPSSTWSRRYGQINTFEQTTVRQGTAIAKVMLHISSEEQKRRLGERLARPDKYWKFNPGDVDERAHWDDYQVAYQAVLDRTNTQHAPWYVVPANEKWYARLAVQHILLGELRALNPQWPAARFDVAEQQARLAAT